MKFISSILTLLVAANSANVASTSTSTIRRAKSAKSRDPCDEDPVLKVAAVAICVRKFEFAVMSFTGGTQEQEDPEAAMALLLGQEFVDGIMEFEAEFGNNDGKRDHVELLGFFTYYYKPICAADLIEMFSVLPDAPVPAPGYG
ncbi:hypothetical protein ACHAXM_006395 [Skeletonema potamos]|jgi:hypothetical protein